MPTRLPDADARDEIANNLDVNLVVEAAAGTGKTTSLVARIVNLLRHGHHNLAAVTFTHKAASELRHRLDARLDQLIGDPETPEETRRTLEQGKRALADCHIGTIHSFCARLLRERPVEAGISPDFTEIDDEEDRLIRERAWERFARQLAGGAHRSLYSIFETFGLDLETLGQGFRKFADFPDIDEWPGRDAGVHQIDAVHFMSGVESYYDSLLPIRDALEDADPGTDGILALLQIFTRRFPRLQLPLGLAEAYRLSGLFKENPDFRQKYWLPLGLDKDAALAAQEAYSRFFQDTVLPFRNQCLAAVYASSLQAYESARDIYDALRLETGVLNFQDLLMRTAAMLRDYPDVRADLAERYARLLIDEVQDTDPVQAEIMFLLASKNPRERDWRWCAPRPGSLFIVGDPKQSIYRFRRADIVVYQELKNLIVKHGGKALGLGSNFRSQPEILAWVNDTYCIAGDADTTPETVAASGRFARAESAHSPAYVPLEPGLQAAPDDVFHGVYRLELLAVSKKDGIGESDTILDEAARIAAFIRNAVDTGLRIPDGKTARPATAGDFMIVTYQKPEAAVYAAALRKMGLDCQVSSGGTLGDSRALRLLRQYLGALDNPDDPVRTLAVLRGELFGISDPDLYRWKKAGYFLDFLHARDDMEPAAIAKTLEMMRRHHRLFSTTEPALALEQVVEDLGLWALAALGDDPSVQTGAVATAIDLLKSEQAATLNRLTERLAWHMDNFEKDPLPAVAPSGQAVRIMNLHKTKGLEAPVVFLTTTRRVKRHAATFAIRREAAAIKAGLALKGGAHNNVLLARPNDWDEMSAAEELFLSAEKTRLNYVAATRAGAALVVSVHPTGKLWKSNYLPFFEPGKTIPDALPEPDAVAPPTITDELTTIDPKALETHDIRKKTRETVLAPTYSVERAKPDFVEAASGDTLLDDAGREDPWKAEEAALVGEILHRLLQRKDEETDTPSIIETMLREFSLPTAWGEQIAELRRGVIASSVWQRAAAASDALREMPFTVALPREGGGVTLRRGVIDLLFREAGGWVVVDYKLDNVARKDTTAAAARHREQLAAYADAWERLSGERVVETGVYFILPGEYVALNTERQGALF